MYRLLNGRTWGINFNIRLSKNNCKNFIMQNPADNIYAYVRMNLPISSANINRTGYMLNERVKYVSQTVVATISVANPNLDGSTGTYVNLITGASGGTLVKRITIKAQGTTTEGMVRIFFKAGATSWLMKEVKIPAVTQSATQDTFMTVIDVPFNLKNTYLLTASTEKAETFIITVEGMDVSYPA